MDAFYGEIRVFPYSFVPAGWAQCYGQSLPVNQYQALYAVIGNTYGGDQNNFNLPDLRNYAIVGAGTDVQGNTFRLNHRVGEASVTLNSNQMPSHDHALQTQYSVTRVTMPSPDAVPVVPLYVTGGKSYLYRAYTPPASSPAIVAMTVQAVGVAGSSGSHENRSPFLQLVYCINVDAEDSTFPVRS